MVTFVTILVVTLGIALVLAVLVGIILGGWKFVLWVLSLAEKDIHLTELPTETGKVIVEGKNVVKILFNSNRVHYGDDGNIVNGKQNLGLMFDLTGRAFFGLSPVREVLHLDVTWNEYAEGKTGEDGRQGPPSLVKRKENGTTIKEFYTHTGMVHGAEMAKESGPSQNVANEEDIDSPEKKPDATDTSVTRIDAAWLVTIRITNPLDAIFKIPPQGIAFSQVDAAQEGAFNDFVRKLKWAEFRGMNKLEQDSKFVTHMREATNIVLKDLGIGMEVMVVELKYYDLTPSPGSEKLAESQTALLTAENLGNAEIALAKKQKEATKLRGEGQEEYLKAVAQVIGNENIGEYAKLGLIPELRVYGGKAAKRALPVINTEGEEK